uniref:Uncharacterized protein n=1 Tax=Equus asinus TaxID=9793 RepID=A0A8C4MDM6_EQUAS
SAQAAAGGLKTSRRRAGLPQSGSTRKRTRDPDDPSEHRAQGLAPSGGEGRSWLMAQALASERQGFRKALTHGDLSRSAEESGTSPFLADMSAKKIVASKYLKMLKEKREDGKEEEDSHNADSDDGEAGS